MTQPPPSRREQMKDAVSQLLTNIKEEKQATSAQALADMARKRKRHRVLVALTFLAAIAFLVTVIVMLPRWSHPFPVPTGEAAVANAERATTYAASLVERFRADHGRLPISLDETGVKLPGMQYVTLGEGYEITVVVEGQPVTHRGGPPVRPVEPAVR